jgi:hypothetical protein
MVNEAAARGGEPFAQKVLEQADIMRDQVARHLERARLAARLTVVGSITEVAPVVTALARTMEKIHRDKNLIIEVHADDKAQFQGERPDLEEMMGNLVDNACKWASSRVSIEVVREPTERAGTDKLFASSLTTMVEVCRHLSASKWRSAASDSTKRSRAPVSDYRSLSNWPLFMAVVLRSAPRRSAACARSWFSRPHSVRSEFRSRRSFALLRPSR